MNNEVVRRVDDMSGGELFPSGYGRGLDLSSRPSGFGAYGPVASGFPADLLVPRSEWRARCEEMDRAKSSVADLCDQAGLKVKDQGRTNFCWANGPVHCVEIVRAVAGQAPTVLSAASVACQINNFKNEGGWGKDALDWIVTNGVVPVDRWPNTAIDRRYATEANVEAASRYVVTDWWELEPRNLDQLISCLFLRVPVAVGYNWWRHEVTAVRPVWLDGEIAIVIDNSWGEGWGTNGRGVLQGQRMLPDDAVAPRVAVAY